MVASTQHEAIDKRRFPMTFRLPPSLQDADDDAQALRYLRCYYRVGPAGDCARYSGAAWDSWDPSGTRANDANRFTSDDLTALTLLSVRVRGDEAITLLLTHREHFAKLLEDVEHDRDLVEETDPIGPKWRAWELHAELDALPDVGRTVASKLQARKRPRLIPIWDKHVRDVCGVGGMHWEPLRLALRADGGALHERLVRLRATAGLGPEVSALRVLDVVTWMQGAGKCWCPA